MSADKLVVQCTKPITTRVSGVGLVEKRETCSMSIAPNSCRATQQPLRHRDIIAPTHASDEFSESRFATMSPATWRKPRRRLFDKVEMKMTTLLKWWRGSNGNAFADYNETRYCVDTKGEPMPMGMGRLHFLSANGKSLGGAGTIEQCKHMAERHATIGKI